MLLLVLATGAMDAACLLHLGVFTAYITASLILAGANLVDSPGSPWPGLVAVAGFIVVLRSWPAGSPVVTSVATVSSNACCSSRPC